MRSVLKSFILTIRGMLLCAISPFLIQAKRPFSNDQIVRILVIRIDGIGDMVLSMPAIKALRLRFPSAHIAVMASEANKDVLCEVTYIDEVIVYRERMDLNELRFDLIFDFLDNYALKTALIVYAIKAKYRVGFDIKGRGVFFNVRVPQPDPDKHYVDIMLDLVASVGAKTEDCSLEIHIQSSAREEAERFLKENNICEGDTIICIHPGAKNWTGRWPPECFARLAEKMILEKSGKVILIGAEYDRALIDEIKGESDGEILCYAGHPLQSVAALIEKANVLVCNNSGLLHVACALNTPTVSTMGPTLAKRWWPVGSRNIVLRKDISCIGCGKGYCAIKTHECMKNITVEEMFEAVSKQLKKSIQ